MIQRGICWLTLLAALSVTWRAEGQTLSSFTPGDLVVYRVGDGSTAVTNGGTAVFIDEYTPNGTLVGSVPMPTVSDSTVGSKVPNSLTASGTATSEGGITVSPNGQYIALAGYDATLGTASVASSSVPRTVGIVKVSNAQVDTTTALTDAAVGNNIRSAVTIDGTNIWVGGATGGVRYTTLGSTTSTAMSDTVVNVRQVNFFGGQLYASSNDNSATKPNTPVLGIASLGTNTQLPMIDGQTITALPGLPVPTNPSAFNPYSFYLADLSSTVPGMDTLYVASDGPSTTAGIYKYSLSVDGTTWTQDGTIGTGTDNYRGLTGAVESNGNVVLFATRQGTNQIVTLTDSSGYDGTFASTPRAISTAGSNEIFRGIGLIPSTSPILFTGDFNLDQHVDAGDLVMMMQALANPAQYEANHGGLSNSQLLTLGDVNHDGVFDNSDVQALLLNLQNGIGSFASVPEPSALALCGLSLAGLCLAACGMRKESQFAATPNDAG